MFGLSILGIIHTAISLVAVGAGVAALVAHGRIVWASALGKVYVVTTVLTCLTGFGIFAHGGPSPAHALGVITLVVLAAAGGLEARPLFGFAPQLSIALYSFSFFLHLVPALNETSTRLPPAAPLATSPENPKLQAAIGLVFVLWLIGAAYQQFRLWRA